MSDREEEMREITRIGESRIANPSDLAERAAEMAYRRGYHQGVHEVLCMLEGTGWWLNKPPSALARYQDIVYKWRLRGLRQGFKKHELPPRAAWRARGPEPKISRRDS